MECKPFFLDDMFGDRSLVWLSFLGPVVVLLLETVNLFGHLLTLSVPVISETVDCLNAYFKIIN
jgi:hypothetical protein